MKTFFILIILLSLQLQLSGQGLNERSLSNPSPLQADLALGSLDVDKFRNNTLEYNDVKGSPYLEKDFLNGYLLLVDNTKTDKIPLQYDIYRNELFYKNENGEELVIDKNYVREIYLTGEDENYILKRINPLRPLKFYDILFESEIFSVYREFDINFYEGKDQGIAKIDPKFSRTDKYFVLQKGEDPKRIKLKKNELFKFFSEDTRKLLENIASEKKLKFKDSKDFKKMFMALMS